jgi:hypothetical protein
MRRGGRAGSGGACPTMNSAASRSSDPRSSVMRVSSASSAVSSAARSSAARRAAEPSAAAPECWTARASSKPTRATAAGSPPICPPRRAELARRSQTRRQRTSVALATSRGSRRKGRRWSHVPHAQPGAIARAPRAGRGAGDGTTRSPEGPRARRGARRTRDWPAQGRFARGRFARNRVAQNRVARNRVARNRSARDQRRLEFASAHHGRCHVRRPRGGLGHGARSLMAAERHRDDARSGLLSSGRAPHIEAMLGSRVTIRRLSCSRCSRPYALPLIDEARRHAAMLPRRRTTGRSRPPRAHRSPAAGSQRSRRTSRRSWS